MDELRAPQRHAPQAQHRATRSKPATSWWRTIEWIVTLGFAAASFGLWYEPWRNYVFAQIASLQPAPTGLQLKPDITDEKMYEMARGLRLPVDAEGWMQVPPRDIASCKRYTAGELTSATLLCNQGYWLQLR